MHWFGTVAAPSPLQEDPSSSSNQCQHELQQSVGSADQPTCSNTALSADAAQPTHLAALDIHSAQHQPVQTTCRGVRIQAASAASPLPEQRLWAQVAVNQVLVVRHKRLAPQHPRRHDHALVHRQLLERSQQRQQRHVARRQQLAVGAAGARQREAALEPEEEGARQQCGSGTAAASMRGWDHMKQRGQGGAPSTAGSISSPGQTSTKPCGGCGELFSALLFCRVTCNRCSSMWQHAGQTDLAAVVCGAVCVASPPCSASLPLPPPLPGFSPQDEQRLLRERHLVEHQHHVQVLRRAPAHVHILQAAPGLVDARRSGIQPPPAVWVGAEVFMVADLWSRAHTKGAGGDTSRQGMAGGQATHAVGLCVLWRPAPAALRWSGGVHACMHAVLVDMRIGATVRSMAAIRGTERSSPHSTATCFCQS